MMRSKLAGALVAAVMLAAVGASAQTSKTARECSYGPNGVQTCTTTTDRGDKTSKMTCSYPNGSITDSSCTFSDKTNAPARESVGYSLSEEARKAAVRKASGYRDPPGTRELR